MNYRCHFCGRKIPGRELIPSLAVQYSSGELLAYPLARLVMGSPLLEEEGYVRFPALSPYLAHPLRFHGSSVWTALSTDNDPVNALQIKAKRL
jgi:hypothetical protein